MIETLPPTDAEERAPGRAPQPRHREVAIAALLDQDDNVLLVRTKKLPEAWQPPGGGMDPGDRTPVDTLAREIDEELGVRFGPDAFEFERRFDYDFGAGNVYCFSARVRRSDRLVVNTAEIDEVRWFPLAEATRLPAYQATRTLLEHLLARSRQRDPARFANALAPFRFTGLELRNRVGLGPINSALFERNGSIRDSHLRFYSRFVDNGVGLLYVGGVAVSEDGRSNAGSLALDGADRLAGIARLADACHQAGVALAVQLMHSGRQARSAEIGHPLVAASAIPCPVVGETPRELTADEIGRLHQQFGEAAAWAEAAGADLVEIHGAHGYLVGGFLSPYSNRRSDEYRAVAGGRSRFLDELVGKVKEYTSLPVGLRVSVIENVAGGLETASLLGTLSHLREALAFLSVSGGVYVLENDLIIPNRRLGPMLWGPQAAMLRRHLAMPVLLSGNFHTLGEIETAIDRGSADVVLLVRTLLADPAFLRKSFAGSGGDVQPCINCNLCKYHTRRLPHVYCPFNEELVAIRRASLKSRR